MCSVVPPSLVTQGIRPLSFVLRPLSFKVGPSHNCPRPLVMVPMGVMLVVFDSRHILPWADVDS
jgi:hypothetical protein